MMKTYTAFVGDLWLATGPEPEIVETLVALADQPAMILVFDDETGQQTDLDLRGATRSEQPERKTRGRPSLGVVSREVTLLPRHWDWLSRQPEGASAALRKLVDAARADDRGNDRAGMNRAYEFTKAMCGDRLGYEEALRALFAGDRSRFEQQIASWPVAIRDHAMNLAFRDPYPD